MSSIIGCVSCEDLVSNPHKWQYKAKKLVAPIVKGTVSLATGVLQFTAEKIRNSIFSGIVGGYAGWAICGASAIWAAKDIYDWYRHRPTPAEKLSPEFYEELEQKNKSKNKDSPLALVELAEHDHNGALSDVGTEAAMLLIANNSRLAIRTVKNRYDIGKKHQDLTDKYGDVDSTYIGAHGNHKLMQLGEGSGAEGDHLYTSSDDHQKHLKGMKGKKLYFMSCSTGPDLAPKVAKGAKLDVWAAMTPAYPYTLSFNPCTPHGSEMNFHLVDDWNEWTGIGGRQDVRIFHSDGTSTEPCLDPLAKKESLIEKADYLKRKSMLGNDLALYELAKLYQDNSSLIVGADKLAEECYENLANKGHPEAFYELGKIYLKSGDTANAVSFLSRAAKGNCADALCFIGDMLEKGIVVNKDVSMAINYYKRAKNLGHGEASYRLGLIYKDKNEIFDALDPSDPDRAVACFRKAVNSHHIHAYYELGQIYKSQIPQIAKIVFKEFNEKFKAIYFVDHADSQFELGCIHEKEGDYIEAAKCFKIAAEQEWDGQAKAQEKFDLLLENEGISLDMLQTEEVLTDAELQYNQGLICQEQDKFSEAEAFFKVAMRNSHPHARMRLAELQYRQGELIEKRDGLEAALKCYYSAYKNGQNRGLIALERYAALRSTIEPGQDGKLDLSVFALVNGRFKAHVLSFDKSELASNDPKQYSYLLTKAFREHPSLNFEDFVTMNRDGIHFKKDGMTIKYKYPENEELFREPASCLVM